MPARQFVWHLSGYIIMTAHHFSGGALAAKHINNVIIPARFANQHNAFVIACFSAFIRWIIVSNQLIISTQAKRIDPWQMLRTENLTFDNMLMKKNSRKPMRLPCRFILVMICSRCSFLSTPVYLFSDRSFFCVFAGFQAQKP